MKTKLIQILCICFIGLTHSAFAANTTPTGLWKSIDDNTGKPRSLIRISETNGEYTAVIEKGLLSTDTGEAICDKCTDARKGQRIVGMTIINGMNQKGENLEGGEILDPENGKTYRCKMKLDKTGNNLEVRGFIGISLFGRSQIWTREE